MKTRILKNLMSVLIVVPFASFGQMAIQGTVTNANGEPIDGAKIVLENTYQGTYSDQNGGYKLQNLASSSYTVVVQHPYFETQRRNVLLTQQTTTIDFQLFANALVVAEMQVSATRANEKTPTSYTNVSLEDIKKSNFGQDLPYLLEGTPSTVVTSDAGAGIGYTGIRIRGVDPTRTNVTINGIPINDSESHGTFWVNMPDLASSVDNIQVQRGVGTSANGAAAFGASINIKTDQIQKKSYAVLDNSAGSFNTFRHTLKAGTGLINNKFSVDMRLSKIKSDGYIDRASSDLKSYSMSGAWLGKKSQIRATVFGGQEVTYQAWYGTPESVLKGTVSDLNAYADRNFLTAEQRQNLLTSGRTYNFYEYANEVDNYKQDHAHLHFYHAFNADIDLTVSGHYTRGRGYFEQFRTDDDLADYGLENVILGSDTVTTTDLIRRRWLDNHFYGGVFALNYRKIKGLQLTWGGAANQYVGDHFGEIIWARFASGSSIYDEYYRNDAKKTDLMSYVRGTYTFKKWIAYGDLQVRNIDYTFLGVDDVSNTLTDIEQNVNYTFFNPKAGLTYQFNANNSVYGSYSIAHREPVRADFRENSPENRPKAEQLRNLEVGYRKTGDKHYLNANVYWMDYTNQLILTGQINDVGGYTRTNVAQSYRLGLELDGGYRISKKLNVSANASISENKVIEFTEFIDDFDNGGQAEVLHQNTDLAFSPNLIMGIGIAYSPIKNLSLNLLVKHVGQQFLDNTSNENRKIDAYSFGNFGINYDLENVVFQKITFGLLVNNIWNSLYENNGYTFSYIAGGQTTTENFYYPQAGTNFLARVVIAF